MREPGGGGWGGVAGGLQTARALLAGPNGVSRSISSSMPDRGTCSQRLRRRGMCVFVRRWRGVCYEWRGAGADEQRRCTCREGRVGGRRLNGQVSGGRVSSVKWDEHGTGLVRASRERRRHGGDPRRRAQQRSDRQSDCARFAEFESRSRGGRSTAGSCCTSALQRLGDWAKRPGTLVQRPTRAASRGARGGGEGAGAVHSSGVR